MTKCPFCATVLLQASRVSRDGGMFACSNCLNACVARRDGYEVQCEAIDGIPDIRRVAPPVSTAGKALAQLGNAIDNLPTLPEIPQRIMAMAHDPLSSLNDIAQVINEDGVIAMKVLKLANSAFYAGLQEIKSLDVACSRLGMKMIVKMISAIGNGHIYKSGDRGFRDQMQQAWRHAVATASCAGEIANLIPGQQSNEAFLAGLIHDIGRVVLLDIFTGRYWGSRQKLTDLLDPYQDTIDAHHALAGLHVIQRWDMGTEFRVATFFHTMPDAVPFEQACPITRVVALAESMADSLGFGPNPSTLTPGQPFEGHPSIAALNLDPDRLTETRDSLLPQIEALANVLEMA